MIDTKTMNSKNTTSLSKALLCAKAMLEKKAENLKILDLSNQSGFTDLFVICSGTNERQIQAICDEVHSTLKAAGHHALSEEGTREGRWALLDFGDVVAHVFLESIRDYYGIENLWSKAKQIEIPQEYYTGAVRN